MQTPIEEDELVTGINVTPLVDVCLVLVIIFMVTAPLLTQPVFKVDLPKARTQEGEEKDKIVITIAPDGRLALDEKEFKDMEDLTRQLRLKLALSEAGYVVIRADKDSLHGRLTDVMARAKEAGALSLTIATQQKK